MIASPREDNSLHLCRRCAEPTLEREHRLIQGVAFGRTRQMNDRDRVLNLDLNVDEVSRMLRLSELHDGPPEPLYGGRVWNLAGHFLLDYSLTSINNVSSSRCLRLSLIERNPLTYSSPRPKRFMARPCLSSASASQIPCVQPP